MRYLIANTYPLSLVRRRAIISPVTLEYLQKEIRENGYVSVWGHENTLPFVNAFLGMDLTPPATRPAISLDHENYPIWADERFTKVLVVSPELPAGFRPSLGQELTAEMIRSWQCLLLDFNGGRD